MPSRLFSLNLDRVHFGDGGLEKSAISLTADTLFSALCVEALKGEGAVGLRQLHSAVTEGTLRFTDALPYIGSMGASTALLMVAKPLVNVRSAADGAATDELSDSNQKKLAKRINFVPLGSLDDFVAGVSDLGEIAEVQSEIGVAGVADRAAIHNGKDDADPYRVGFFTFKAGAGLWVMASGTEPELDLLTKLLEQLAHVGVGGERSSGYGQFSLEAGDAPPELAGRAVSPSPDSQLLLLTTSLPADDELETALDGATYRLVKRSGFVASHTYSETPLRKRDMYKFAAGSVFSKPFDGVVADVNNGGSHAVYSYAKPLFLALKGAAA